MLSSYPSWKVISVWFSVRPCQRRPFSTQASYVDVKMYYSAEGTHVWEHATTTLLKGISELHTAVSHWAMAILAWAGWSSPDFCIYFFLPLVTFTTQMSLLCFRKLQEVKRLQPKPLSELKCLSFFVAKHPKAKYFKTSSADNES